MRIGILHTAFIGDIILTGLLIEALFEARHEIIFFTKKNTANIFVADLRIQKVVIIEKKPGFAKLFAPIKIAKVIKGEKCDVLLVPHRSLSSTLSAFLAKVKVTVGFNTATFSFLYKKIIFFDKKLHECQRYLTLAANFIAPEIYVKNEKIGRPILRYHDAIYKNFEERFLNYNFLQVYFTGKNLAWNRIKENFFILALGSIWATKKYLVEYWVEVAFFLLEKYPHYFCALTGSRADMQDTQRFIQLFVAKCTDSGKVDLIDKLVDTTNIFSLSDFAIFVSYAKFVFANDSAPIHFASAFNIPVLSVFGPTSPKFGFGPTSNNSIIISLERHGPKLACQPCTKHGSHLCPKKHFKCMKNLRPEIIINQLQQLLLEG